MATKHKDITGLRSGRLVAARYLGNSIWECVCDCGGTKTVPITALQRQSTTSCGCRHGLTTHGMARSATYRSWSHMHQRCYNPNARQYKWYGALGISVTERWKSFELFLRDMGVRPNGYSLDRIDPSKDYSPENCRWAVTTTGRKRSTPMIEGQTISEYAAQHGLKYHTAYARLRKLNS